jgi:D-lactate dehydrogenase (cytochrome)
MFRAARPLSRLYASPLLARGVVRQRSTAAQTVGKPIVGQRPLWTSRRVLLLTAFTASLTYLYGVNDASPHFKLPWPGGFRKPSYANKTDMEKVHFGSGDALLLISMLIM